MPIGAAAIVEPHPGLDVDWLVLGAGWVIAPLLVLAGSAAAAATALTAQASTEPSAGPPWRWPQPEPDCPCRW